MYTSPSSLVPLLSPTAYYRDEDWQRERLAVFADAWHLVGVASELSRPGKYISLDLLGVPVLIRNFDGEIVAVRNVCAHRQSLLVTRSSGCSPKLKCPYHGWEYGADGRTRKLPGASNFPAFDHAQYALDRFPVDRCGDLLFIRLSAQGPTLQQWIGADRFPLLQAWFSGPDYELARRFRLEFPANWKIPTEAALESYHIPCVHPQTFNEDPGEARSTHQFFGTGSSFETVFLAPRWIDRRLRDAERFVLRILGVPYTGHYQHHHVFPNLLISHTDSLSLVQVVIPTGPVTSYSLVWQFARMPARQGAVRKVWARGWGQFTAWLTRTILGEDQQIYPLVQAGTAGAARQGILGRCEERLYALQKHVREKLDSHCTPDPGVATDGDLGCSRQMRQTGTPNKSGSDHD